MLHVAFNYVVKGGKKVRKDTKTHQDRYLAIDPVTCALVRSTSPQPGRARRHRRETRADAYLFSNQPANTQPWNPDWATHRVADLAAAAGVELNIKAMRHYTASQLLAAGFDLGNTAARLGHSGGGATTLKHYATQSPRSTGAPPLTSRSSPRAGQRAADSDHTEVSSPMIPAISLLAAAGSDTGLVRKNNEDAAYWGRWLYAVADGMGGHAVGEVASAAVIESLRRHDTGVDPDALLETLGRAVTEANSEVARAAAEDTARRGMGTTLTAMPWSDSRFALANIGDSRAFSLREGRFRQITEDHVLGKLVSNAGRLAPVLSRYLDGRPDRSPDLSLHEARPGDCYMICSDRPESSCGN